MKKTDFISFISIDDKGLPAATPEVVHERNVAIYDILQDNRFGLENNKNKNYPCGPFRLYLSIKNLQLVFNVEDENAIKRYQFYFSLTPLRPVMKDYFEICNSYFDAVKRLPPGQIEAIDMGRRGIHLEGSKALLERLKGKVKTDEITAKRLFTLICALRLY
jgi:uncharacterized protein (UPF0262 family)